MPATRAAFEVNAAQSMQGNEQDFSAVILQMEKQAHLDLMDEVGCPLPNEIPNGDC